MNVETGNLKFLIDLQCLQNGPPQRPVARISRGLTEALISGSEGELSVMINIVLEENLEELRSWLGERIPSERIRLFRGLRGVRRSDKLNAHRGQVCQALYDAFVRVGPLDLILVASPFEGFREDIAFGGGALSALGPTRAALVHDSVNVTGLHCVNRVQSDWYRERLSWLSEVDLVLANSEYGRRTLIESLGIGPSQVVNISFDIEPEFCTQPLPSSPSSRDASLLSKYGIAAPFVLHPCGPDPSQTLERVLRAFAYLPPEIASSHKVVLIVTTTPVHTRQMRAVARKVGINPRQLVLPQIDTLEDLAALYAAARAVVVGSAGEGMNLRLLEAMRCGAAVLAADDGNLPELLGNRDLIFEGKVLSSLGLKLKSLLSNEAMRLRALTHSSDRAKCFSWTKSAARAHEAFAETVRRRRASKQPVAKPSFVMVPPIKLCRDLSRRVGQLAAELRDSGTVLLAAPQGADANPELFPGMRLVDPGRIGIVGDQRVVMVVGSEGIDAIQHDLLAKMPAVALLSDEQRTGYLSNEMLYHVGGYGAVLHASRSRTIDTSLDSALMAHPNVLGVIRGPQQLAARIEAAYANHPLGIVPSLLERVGKIEDADPAAVAAAIAENQAGPAIPRLLVDISELVLRDAKTGIQRVVRAVLKYLLTEPYERRVEPVYRDRDRHVYRYARRFTCQFLDLPQLGLPDSVVDFRPSDIFFGLDLDVEVITGGAANLWRDLRRRGGRVCLLMHDLFSITRPDWFVRGNQGAFIEWFRLLATEADQLIAVSRVVADEIFERVDWLRPARSRPLDIAWVHNGSDLAGSVPTQGIRPAEATAFELLKGQTIFLTVGTIEPRKGVSQLLDAAQILWRERELAFVLVGRRGWRVDELVTRIETHPELGRRLFWFDSVSDEVLDRLYSLATAAVLPSEGEGFGLPLVEAARHRTPIIARNLPVFREIAGDGAFYFDANTGERLAAALRRWLTLHDAHKSPSPEKIVCLTWRESARQLLDTIDGRRPYRSWVPSVGSGWA